MYEQQYEWCMSDVLGLQIFYPSGHVADNHQLKTGGIQISKRIFVKLIHIFILYVGNDTSLHKFKFIFQYLKKQYILKFLNLFSSNRHVEKDMSPFDGKFH